MSTPNDNSNLATQQVRELRDDELQEVSGGRKGGTIVVFDYEGSALRTQHPAKVTVPDIKLGVS